MSLLQQAFDETKKVKSTMDRSGAVPAGFKIVRVDEVSDRAWSDTYMGHLQNVLGSGREMSNVSPKTSRIGAKLVRSVSRDPLKADAEAVLFHGTSPSAVKGILSSGFDRDRCKFGLAGKGFYFAESISKSDEYTQPVDGLRCVLVCRVVIGRAQVCAAVQPTDQYKQKLEDSVLKEGTYDSVMMDRERCRGTFREFVVYETSRCLPLFVVWYQQRAD